MCRVRVRVRDYVTGIVTQRRDATQTRNIRSNGPSTQDKTRHVFIYLANATRRNYSHFPYAVGENYTREETILFRFKAWAALVDLDDKFPLQSHLQSRTTQIRYRESLNGAKAILSTSSIKTIHKYV